MTSIEELCELVQGHWVGTYVEGRRTYPTEIGFTSNTRVVDPNTINVHAFARDRRGMYDLRGTISRGNRFDFTQRQGYIRGEVDVEARSMTGSWGLNMRRFDGNFVVRKEYSQEDRRRDAEKKRERKEAEARQKQEEDDARQAEATRKQQEEEVERQRQAEAEAQRKKEEEKAEKEGQAEARQKQGDETRRRAQIDAGSAQTHQVDENDARREASKAIPEAREETKDAANAIEPENEAMQTAAPQPTLQQDSAIDTALRDLPSNDPSPNRTNNIMTTSSTADSDSVKVVTSRAHTLAPRKPHNLPLKLNRTVTVDVYIKVITALHGDAPVQLL